MTVGISKKMSMEQAEERLHKHDAEHNEEHDSHDEEDEELEGAEMMHLNRNEKKARKLLSKVGMTLVPGIERVTIKRGRMIFAIANPTVYKTAQDQYVVFGEAKVEDAGFQAQAMAAQRLAAQRQAEAGEEVDEKAAVVEEEETEEVDASGVDEKDIKLVMEQANVSRARAIKALKDNDNDIVNTIMELTNM